MISVILFGENKKSLEKQTLKDIEIISVGAEDISARNKALKEVKGEYVTFVSAKDELAPDYLEYLTKGMVGAHLSVCGYNIEEDGKCLYETPESVPRMMSGEDMQCRLFYQYHYQGYLQNKMFRRQIIQSKHLLFDETLEENGDFLFLMQYLRYAKLVRLQPEVKYHFHPYQGLKKSTKSDAMMKISETEGYLRCLKELPKRSDAMWLGEQTAAGSALMAYEAMEIEARKKNDPELFVKSSMKKMAKKCLKLDYEIEDEEEEQLFLGLLEYSKTGKVLL
ncbi:MAG: glycosyltransferase family 2 protein [Lachnospiraceae bacterium]|nr:glycosyltransferase family 2 protein [Lachnospiraceae bacterium]